MSTNNVCLDTYYRNYLIPIIIRNYNRIKIAFVDNHMQIRCMVI